MHVTELANCRATATGESSSALRHAISTDVDEHSEKLGPWHLSYDQISPGGFSGSFTQLSLPAIDVFREATNQRVRQSGRLGDRRFGIGLPWTANAILHCNGVSAADPQAVACFDAEIDMCTPEAFELRGIVVDCARIEEVADALGIALPRTLWHQFLVIETAAEPTMRLRQVLTAVEDAIATSPEVFDRPTACRSLEDSLVIEVADLLETARPSDRLRTAASYKRTVDRACDIMLADCGEAISILDVCRAVGASRRKLNYCFQEVLGTTPISYLRAIRLNRVRRDLRTCAVPGAGVYDIAVTYGFWHFSQFSLDYKRHFGETPSETLRRARMG